MAVCDGHSERASNCDGRARGNVARNEFVQSGNIKFQIEAFYSAESALDVAREQLGIFIGEFFVR